MGLKIFTDGACLGNPGPGGWAALIIDGDLHKELSGSALDTTNNRMELAAVIKALQSLTLPCRVTLYTDSQYVKNGVTIWSHSWQKNGWKTSQKKPVKNQDLWVILLGVVAKHKVEWVWVKGHSGHQENDHVDHLAQKEARVLASSSRSIENTRL